MIGGIKSFLQRNTLPRIDLPPLVHSTRSANLKYVLNDEKIQVAKCDVFNKDLNYFFIGRPAYKNKSASHTVADWELPTCFIFDFKAISSIHKIFPFDTGAYHADGLMPSYVSCMAMSEYEVQPDFGSVERLLGAMFSTSRNYFLLKNVISEDDLKNNYEVDMLNPEILALRRLANDEGKNKIDDRRFAIEVSSEKSVSIEANNLLAVVCPSIYLDDKIFANKIENEWKAKPIPYASLPLNYDQHVGEIYAKVLEFYEREGLVK